MYTDEQIVKIIKLLQRGEGDESQLAYWMNHELKGLDEIYDLIFFLK
ncbi:MAG: hypothetical protein JSS34_08460 [Proteobacteria bacterium]|nr:hypothetical protein [Pseudomonadota bacterium]